MFAITVKYLDGVARAARIDDRSRPEWPPHPDRLFMAMASACFTPDPVTGGREALQWLERQEPPKIRAGRAWARSSVDVFVPVNGDIKAGKNTAPLIKLLPEHRERQNRSFPAVTLEDPEVHFIWPEDPPEEIRGSLDALCSRITRLGHPTSFVEVWVNDSPPEANLVPSDGIGRYRLRTPSPGKLEYLENMHRLEKRPNEHRVWTGYREPDRNGARPSLSSAFIDDLIVLRKVSGHPLHLRATLFLTGVVRAAILSSCPKPVPEWISGHTPDGNFSRRLHMAILPLPFVGAEHADSRIMGVALAIPRDVPVSEIRRCLGPFLSGDPESAGQIHIYSGNLLDWKLELSDPESSPVNLQCETWTRPCRRWVSVTPAVWDRHPRKGTYWQDLGNILAASCTHTGLPVPVEVRPGPVSPWIGVPHASVFPRFRSRCHSHVEILFPEPVKGPVLVGAGIYRGYGLFRPKKEKA